MENLDEIDNLYIEFYSKPKSKNLTDAQKQENVAYEKLYATMTKEQQKLFLDYLDYNAEVWLKECFDAYRNGFQAGMRLLYNALKK